MGSPSKDLILTEDMLRLVIESLIDAQEGLQKVGEEVKDESLKRLLLSESLKRAQFRGELEGILHREGERDLNVSGTAAAKVVRAWTGLKAAFGGGDHALLEIAEEGDDATIRTYREALEKDLPLPVREVLDTQVLEIESALGSLRSLRESKK